MYGLGEALAATSLELKQAKAMLASMARVCEAARVLRGAWAMGDDKARGAAIVELIRSVDALEKGEANGL